MRKYNLILLTLVATGCLHPGPIQRPTPPTQAQIAERTAICTAIWREELDRPAPYIDEEGLHGCLDQLNAGASADVVRRNVQQSKEYADRQARLDEERKRAEEREKLKGKLRGRLQTAGRDFVDAESRKFLPIFASELILLSQDESGWNVIFTLLRENGFNGFRVFAGHLAWTTPTQTIELAEGKIARLVNRAGEFGLYVLVTATTDSRVGAYDVRQHLERMRDLTASLENVLLEVGNELYHSTQSDLVNNISALCTMAKEVLRDYPNPWALGAAADDLPVNGKYASDCGTFNTSHLRRLTNVDEMVAAMTGLAAIGFVHDKPTINSEMIGAGERDEPGRRTADPAVIRRLAKRAMSYGLGSVFHSEEGLFARPWGPRQMEAARAFVDASLGEPEEVPAPVVLDVCDDANLQSHLAVIECERGKYQGTFLTDDQIVELLRHAARQMNRRGLAGGPFGLLAKDGGTNCNSYSCDIVCSGQGSQQRQWDALSAVRERNIPAWQEVDRAVGLVERFCEVQR